MAVKIKKETKKKKRAEHFDGKMKQAAQQLLDHACCACSFVCT
jgi:hypothetical protein